MAWCDDERYMRIAIEAAERAAAMGEIPVGAVIIADGEILAVTHNLCETEGVATAHAELLAVEAASRKRNHWRLSDCTLYVTLEPCPMCMGALINARIGRVVFGAKDARAGACGSLLSLASYPLEATPSVTGGVLAEECLVPLRDFFAAMRRRRAESRRGSADEE